jgi:hypothetical protein
MTPASGRFGLELIELHPSARNHARQIGRCITMSKPRFTAPAANAALEPRLCPP